MSILEKLGEITTPKKSVLGGKIYWLDRLKKEGFTVSEGFCIKSEYFNEFVSDNGINISELSAGKIFKYDDVRKVIYSAKFSSKQEDELKKEYDKLVKPLIVRSSASVEDSDAQSCAGLFTSVNDVDSFEKFINAVKVCWISSFNEVIDNCVGDRSEYGISLLVQEQLLFDCGGVAFSVDPISMNYNEMLVESCPEGPKAVVTGSGEIEQISLKRNVDEEQQDYLKKIKEVLLKVEKLFEKPVDMEWIYRAGKLYVLQARPITTVENKLAYIEVDDDAAMTLPLKNVLKIHARWLEKKIPIRKVCRENNINVGKFYYWFRENDSNGSELSKLLESYQSTVCELYDGENTLLVDKSEVAKTACGMKAEVIRVGESIPTQYAGFSSAIENKYYVETVKGGFAGFYKGEFVPTKYVLDDNENIIMADERVFDSAYFFDGSWWNKFEIESEKVILDKNVLKQIVNMTKALNRAYENVRAEWILNGAEVYLFDVTVEKEKLVDIYGNGKVLAKGKCKGQAFVLDDVRIFDSEIKHVSIRMGYEFENIKNNSEINKIKDSLEIPENAIIVCEYPNEKLAVLADKVKGFIFERGSLLCHFAIILREKGMPGVIFPDARKAINNGQQIEIVDGSIMID